MTCSRARENSQLNRCELNNIMITKEDVESEMEEREKMHF